MAVAVEQENSAKVMRYLFAGGHEKSPLGGHSPPLGWTAPLC